MHFRFFPALGESVQVSVSPVRTTSLQLRFEARLSSEDYHQFCSVGANLQLWSNIGTAGEWGQLDFQSSPSESSNATAISLLGPSDYNDQSKALFLAVSIPFPAEPLHYSFTYRLVYPSGEIKWLGSFGHNGSLVVDKKNSYLLKYDGWNVSDTSLTWNTQEGNLVQNHPIASILDLQNWIVHSVGGSSLADPKDCSLLIFTTKPRAPLLLPHTFVIFTSPNTSVSLLPNGEITASGAGSVFWQSFDPHMTDLDAFLARILRNSPPSSLRLITVVKDHVIFASTEQLPIKVIAVRLSPALSLAPSILSVKQGVLSALLQHDTEFSLFTPLDQKVRFFSTTNDEADDLTFHIASSGGQFVLSPVYTIRGDSNSPGTQISILSPFVPPVNDLEDSLPTPPPSPHLRPIAHLSQLTAEDRNSSNLSISDMDIPSRRASPIPELLISESSSMPAVRPQAAQMRRSSSLVSLRSQMESRNIIIKLLKYYFKATIYVALLLLRVVFNLHGRRNADRTDDSESTSVVNERTPLLAEPDTPPPAEESVIMPSAAQAPGSPSRLFIDLIGDGKVSFIQRYLDSHRLAVEFNGMALEHPLITRLDGGAGLVEFSVSSGENKRGGKIGKIKFEVSESL